MKDFETADWILRFVIIIFAIAGSFLAAVIHFLDQKRVFYNFSHRKLFNWFLIRTRALLVVLLPTVRTLIFHLQYASDMLNYFMFFIQSASKHKPDFGLLHLLWWQKEVRMKHKNTASFIESLAVSYWNLKFTYMLTHLPVSCHLDLFRIYTFQCHYFNNMLKITNKWAIWFISRQG